MYIFSFYYCYFFGFVGRSWSFLGLVPTQVHSMFFPSLASFFVGVFPGLRVSLVDTYPKLRVIFLDVFFTILFFRLSWSSIKRSGLLRHNKPEMLLVVICVLLGSLLLRTEWLKFVSRVARFLSVTVLCPAAHFPYWPYKGVAPPPPHHPR